MSKWINITSIVVFALFLRCLFMVGFALGDDHTYAQYAYMITQGMYPPLCDLCVFSFRPILLFSMALSLKVLGWSEFNFVLPILLSSLISIYLVYGLGKVLFDQPTGLVAAFCLAIFPLNLVHASTMSNDIMLSMLVALSMLLFLRGFMDERDKTIIYFIAAGCILGSATGVKINALPLVGLFILIALYYGWQEKRLRKEALFFLLSWLTVQLVFSLAYYMQTGDFLVHIQVELNFNKTYNPSGFVNSPWYLKNALLYYPKLMLGLQTEGHPGYTFYPYGFFYPVFFLGTIYFVYKRERRVMLPLLWFTYTFLIMEFFPLHLSPYYQPIHRLIRFLSIISIPAILIIAYFLRRLFATSLSGKLFSTLLLAGLLITSLHQAYRKSSFYGDCMSDAREVYNVIKHMPYTQVITDHEMKETLLFYNHYTNSDKFKSFDYNNPTFLTGSLVILGGARRPDLSPSYATQFIRPPIPQTNWLKVCEVKGRKTIWRKDNLVVYKILGE
jgi:4-amino-4-deoxy-L-arabinose transferase-like glycosyltransferase